MTFTRALAGPLLMSAHRGKVTISEPLRLRARLERPLDRIGLSAGKTFDASEPGASAIPTNTQQALRGLSGGCRRPRGTREQHGRPGRFILGRERISRRGAVQKVDCAHVRTTAAAGA